MLDAFERKVVDSLNGLLGERRPKIVGVAVSGGADSVCLLRVLSKAFALEREEKKSDFPKLVCVTVDHSIRPESESSGDAAFVAELRKKFGVACFVKKIERGFVEKTAAGRSNGLEDAARFLRYKLFEEFASESGAEFVCLAHNQNDFLETVLMRFLQGSSASGLGGIAAARGIYLRPLLGVGRAEIEGYLRRQKIEWRTDSTNFDNSYLRNKIRNLLLPFLDENFDGWKKALLSAAEKSTLENEALEKFLDLSLEGGGGFVVGEDGVAEISKNLFFRMPVALRRRLLFRAFDLLKAPARVPNSFVRQISSWPEKDFKNACAAGLEAFSKKDKVFIKIQQKEATEKGFFDIIMEKGPLSEAFVLRSRATGDKAK
ncbi:MAG: tRNA lysidine(34) synthetase TilS [Treponema sp.]|nr:tRNA lysidine(34) synthetase TilS [Treponema sp.]